METESFVRSCRIGAPAREVFAWHAREGAFDRLLPPWERVEIVERTGGIRDGARVTLRTRLGPIGLTWSLEHRDYLEGERFRDVQLSGPFSRWAHTHLVVPEGERVSRLEDRIEYALPLGGLGKMVAGRMVRSRLDRLFDYRHDVMIHDLAAHAAAGREGTMKVLVTGSGGLIGSALIPFLTSGGYEVARLVRSTGAARPGDAVWDPMSEGAEGLSAPALEGVDAVVHLAGEPIAEGRWSDAKKERIRSSRTVGTRHLARALAGLKTPPRVLVCSSAVGWYGDRGDEVLTEDSTTGTGFLAEVCRGWEEATAPAAERGIRVVNLRTGIVLSPRGGALGKMLTPFRLGAGGRIGDGSQYMSWISLDDMVGVIGYALTRDGISGPVNAVAPAPVTNAEFTKTLGRVLRRPTIFPMPAFAARLAFGEVADALLLSSCRVLPERLQKAGYAFRHADLETALRHLLGKTRS